MPPQPKLWNHGVLVRVDALTADHGMGGRDTDQQRRAGSQEDFHPSNGDRAGRPPRCGEPVSPRFLQANSRKLRSMSVLVPPAHLIGNEVEVPCADGLARRYVNLDYAASTPVLAAVWDMVEAFVPWYSSVHRGTGAKSQVSTDGLRARARRRRGLRGRRGLQRRLRAQHDRGDQRACDRAAARARKVLSTPVEHHANMLPWRRHDLQHAAVHDLGRRAARRSPKRALREARDRPAGGDRRLERHGRGLAAAGARRARPRARRTALRRRRPARAAPRDRHAARGDRPPRAVRPQALRAVRRRRARQPRAAGRRGAAARRRRDQARHARRRRVGRRARPLRGGLTQRDRRRGLRRRLRGADELGMDAVADRERALPSCSTTAWRRSPG